MARTGAARDPADGSKWLVLLYQFPAGPDSRRVRLWRRLQSIGALAIKHSVYVLPYTDEAREDFEWLLAEVRANGADGAILESRFIDGMSDEQMKEQFRTARDADYEELIEEIGEFSSKWREQEPDAAARAEARRILSRVRKRAAEIQAIDFFGARTQKALEAAIRELASQANHDDPAASTGTSQAGALTDLAGRVWVTRRGVGVDRIASAWLIRRWIDSRATFRFVDPSGYEPRDNETRFDMFEAEFTHEGDLCTFEVLARLVATDDEALRNVGEIIHDIDLKDGKFSRPETDGVALLLEGITAASDDDNERIRRGSDLFENLYRSFGGPSP